MTKDAVLMRCNNCRTVNQVSVDKLMKNPRCGNCKAFLEIPQKPIEVTTANFDQEVLEWPDVVLVEFWAPWCGHCLIMAPILDKLAHERAGLLKVVKVNVDNEPSLGARFKLHATPLLVLYRNGQKLNEIIGALPKTELEAWIDSSTGG
ncbi:MAG: thioredoxin TrxC [Nitrospirota bacterium]|nr:thioredoxin TrxC [Nitrospirota bacterium]